MQDRYPTRGKKAHCDDSSIDETRIAKWQLNKQVAGDMICLLQVWTMLYLLHQRPQA